jgi:hypothetical protein
VLIALRRHNNLLRNWKNGRVKFQSRVRDENYDLKRRKKNGALFVISLEQETLNGKISALQ